MTIKAMRRPAGPATTALDNVFEKALFTPDCAAVLNEALAFVG